MSNTGSGERRTRVGGLALLEWLRPPSGYVTDAALGTTYSLDLVSATAALVALDGAARDHADFSLPAALRARHRLSDHVRLAVQQGCIHWHPGTKPGMLPLLDRVVRPVNRSLAEGAFHPKVWVVRQRPAAGENGEVRYVLVVGSRNLTRDTAWDLGVAMHGYVRPGEAGGLGGAEDLVDFVRFACEAGQEPDFAARFSDLGSVDWERPPRVQEARFGFHGRRRVSWSDTALMSLPDDTRKVLIFSPFLDTAAIKQAAARWGDVPDRRLVSGTASLDEIARTQQRAALELLEPRYMQIARDEPPSRRGEDAASAEVPSGAAEEDRETMEASRGLHAKVIAVWYKRRASLLVGSANLTRRGWLGDNGEAWLLLTGDPTVADALWDWSTYQSAEYHAPRQLTTEDDLEADQLDLAHQYVSARAYTLREDGADGEAHLEADQPPIPPSLAAMELRVARLSQPAVTSPWVPEAPATVLPPCAASERTALIVFTLRTGAHAEALERSWVQHVTVEPPLDDQRDGALLRRVLGPAEFLAYLRGFLDPTASDGPDEPADGSVDLTRGGGGGAADTGALRIEGLLRALAKSPKETLSSVGNAIAHYRAATNGAEDPVLSKLWEVWRAVEEAYGR